MTYREALNTSKNTPSCCDKAFVRFEKYMPSKKKVPEITQDIFNTVEENTAVPNDEVTLPIEAQETKKASPKRKKRRCYYRWW